jgi:predicted chitinase
MSIFKSTFSPTVQDQLKARQNAMTDRTPQNLSYLNSRNAWIRMQSSVNVDGSSDLAKAYVLQGGTLNYSLNQNKNEFSLTKKSGIGSSFSNAYSNKAYDGTKYQRGIRPMPGITDMDIKSLSAYGSLREITVNFQCWDIQQLEDLELLYMRPGYTVLIEWGWAPYLDNDGNYKSTFYDYYDILHKANTNRTTLFKELYDKSVKYNGNYDAMFGYIKNYQWSARPDGGYDCQTVVISTGEIIESLKINYLIPQKIETVDQGLLKDEFTSPGTSTEWIEKYQRNILAGMWAELYYKYTSNPTSIVKGENGKTNSAINYQANLLKITNLYLTSTNPNPDSLVGTTGNQLYITLDTALNFLNKYIIAKSGTDKNPLVELSLLSNNYEKDNPPTDLLCVAHPLQVSVDPSICLIKSPAWYEDGGTIVAPTVQAVQEDPSQGIAKSAFNDIKIGWQGGFADPTDESALLRGVRKITNVGIYNAVNIFISEDPDAKKEKYSDLNSVLNGELGTGDLDTVKLMKRHLEGKGFKVDVVEAGNLGIDVESITITPPPTTTISTAESEATIEKKAKPALSNLQILKDIPYGYFYGNERGFDEIGYIKNIYVNVDYLYLKALDSSLESSDPRQKNEINLYNYLKKIISDIQAAIGNINSFEIHVDPVSNNVARIIDVNYTEPKKASYDSLFQLEVHNLDSIVRSYSFQSQIFPNQSSAIAIGAQAKGGQLGMQNNTMIDFNRNLTDRIIPEKVDGINSPTGSVENNKPTITNGVAQIVNLFASINLKDTKTDYSTLASKAKNALHDIIAYFQTLCKSPGSNRNIIPTKFTCDIDGIGGLVIGHMFKLPPNIIPRGYRGDGAGVQMGQAITRIGHSISNGDWVTKIETLNMVLEDPVSGVAFSSLDLSDLSTITLAVVSNEIQGGGGGGGGVNITTDIKSNLDEIEKACRAQGLTNTYIIKAIKANVLKETGGVAQNENLSGYANTSNDRIRKIFGTRFASVSEADLTTLKKNTPEFAEYIYGLKSGKTGIGLGNTVQGDGYKFRGRGYIGITGKALYTKCGKALGKDFITNPDTLNTPENAAASTVWYIKESLKVLAPRSDYKLDPTNPQPQNQLEANRLITNCIGGVGLKLTRPPSSAIFSEILGKVDRYSAQV